LNFKTLTLKLGRGETIVEIKKFKFFDKKYPFQNWSQERIINISKYLIMRLFKR